MKKLLALVILSFIATSCDDGDLIVTEIDFDDLELELCTDSEYVFYKINTSTNETLALQFTTSQDIFGGVDELDDITLSGDDQVSYRRFNDAVSSDYFCSLIPPATPVVAEEFISTEGEVLITRSGTETDEDGIPSEIEDPEGVAGTADLKDTDEDGIPDILDSDDDGDNVPTELEGVVLNEDGTAIDTMLSRDTDGDEIPDYLDPDDDGDGVLTRNEDANMDLNPANDNSNPDAPTEDDYLNPAIAVETIVDEYRDNEYVITDFQISIFTRLLVYINPANQDEQRDESTQNFGVYTSPDVVITEKPDFNE